MKSLIATTALTYLLSFPVWAQNTFSFKVTNHLVFANSPDSGFVVKTNLVVFEPPYGTNPPANFPAMAKTNGLECKLIMLNGNPANCLVSVFNHSTNEMTYLRMPTAVACRLALLDQQGHQVKKTAVRMKHGLPLSQEQIESESTHWSKPRQGRFLPLFPNGTFETNPCPTDICEINLMEIFQIKEPGDYELHLQVRLIQIGQDRSGQFYYPVTWLPEVAVKVQISPEDIPKKWWQF